MSIPSVATTDCTDIIMVLKKIRTLPIQLPNTRQEFPKFRFRGRDCLVPMKQFCQESNS